jgi:hypothetical protein
MALDYAVEPNPIQRMKPRFQNWRLVVFVAALCIPFAWMGYTLLSESLSNGIHQHGDYTYVDLKSLGQFPFNDQTGVLTDVPKDYRQLDGKRVELKGMMWTPASAGGAVSEFQLVYNIQKCCFNGPPQVQERVFVHFHKRFNWYDQLVTVTGKLHVRLKKNDMGSIYSVYDLDLEDVQPASVS